MMLKLFSLLKKKPSAKRSSTEWRGIALFGYTLIIMTFGVAGVWAAVAQIDKAIIASGFVAAETNRKTVMHLEGGIVREIRVKEGDHVALNQELFQLDQVQAKANDELVRNQMDSSMALEARLTAERDGAAEITWPSVFKDRMTESNLAHILNDQIDQFNKRKASLEGQKSVLASRVDQLRNEIKGIEIQKDSAEKQNTYIGEELVGLRDLASKHLVPMTRVYAMERERTRLEGEIGRALADSAKAQSSIGEITMQIQELQQKFQEDVAANLLETRQKLADLRQKGSVSEDVLQRLVIKAPRSGTVQNLKVSTVGQVIRTGEPLLEIAPDNEELVVHAQFSTTDVDKVYAGMQAEIRFPAFHSRTIPVMFGKINSISHDRVLDDSNHQYYFLGVISLARADIPEDYRERVRAGMPAEIIVSAGERTVLNYLVSPLSSALRKTFREQAD